jgi:MFS family permease
VRHDRLVQGYALATALSRAGDSVWTVALAWTAVRLASPAVAGLVLAAGTIPRALVLLYGGVVADRFDPLRVMRLTNLARTAVLVVTAAAGWAGELSVPVLVAAAVLFGLADGLYDPSSSTVPRQLLQGPDLAAYSGLAQTAQRLGSTCGAALGGVLVAAGGLATCAVVDAVTFLAMAGYLVLVRPRHPLQRAEGHWLRGILAGFAHLRDEPTTRTLVLTLMGLNLALVPAETLGLALRVQHEGWGAHAFGIFDAIAGAGSVAGSALTLVRVPRRVAVWGFGFLVAQGLAIIVLGVGGPVVVGAASLVIGVTAGAASVLLGSVFMQTVAEAYLGRMSSIQRLGDDVFMPAASGLFGVLAASTAVPVPFVLYGGLMALVMLAVLRIRAIRRLTLQAPGQREPVPTG